MVDAVGEGIMDKEENRSPEVPEVAISTNGAEELEDRTETVAINIDALSLWYTGVQAIENVSLQIPESHHPI